MATKIEEEFKKICVKITGSVDVSKRQALVDKFQDDSSCKLFIGTLHSCGQGITLTPSSDVLFAEIDWTPATLCQAEDRCHRIGQKNYVSITHMVFDESIDGMLIEKIIEKQEIIDQVTK